MRTGGGEPALVPSEVGQVGLGEWALRGEQDRPRWFSECFEEKEGVGGWTFPETLAGCVGLSGPTSPSTSFLLEAKKLKEEGRELITVNFISGLDLGMGDLCSPG